jgi:hypothetical protein
MGIPVTPVSLPARATSGQVTLSTETRTTPSSSTWGVCLASDNFTVQIANVPSTTSVLQMDFSEVSGIPPLELDPQATGSAERTVPPLLFLQPMLLL